MSYKASNLIDTFINCLNEWYPNQKTLDVLNENTVNEIRLLSICRSCEIYLTMES